MKKIILTSTMLCFFFFSCNKTIKNNNPKVSFEKLINSNNSYSILEDIQKIADANNNNRYVGSKGNIATLEYIKEKLKTNNIPFTEQHFKDALGNDGTNIIATINGESSDIIMLGAHLDSVKQGPGINDNASGIAAILEAVLTVKKEGQKPKKTLQFSFWDSEENKISGSNEYIKSLNKEQIKQIIAYLNFDMLGTKDPVYYILDGDKSSIKDFRKTLEESGLKKNEIDDFIKSQESISIAEGSDKIESLVLDFFKMNNIKNVKQDLSLINATDVQPFIKEIPSTSISAFHEVLNNDNELEFAPCYHKDCDKIDGIDKDTFNKMNQLIGYLIDHLAY